MTSSMRERSKLVCAGKVQHETLSSALKAAKRRGGGLQPYRCPRCEKYHTGRNAEQKMARLRKRVMESE
jgi:hypothetical protein